VSRGVLKTGVHGEDAELAERDFISFSADRPHFYEALTEMVEATLIVIYPLPSVTAPGA
jgi:quercetin dioxygenase-like cupin family protein